MKNAVISLHAQVELPAVSIKVDVDTMILLRQGSFMTDVLAVHMMGAVAQFLVVMDI